jgi:hypothetical protein
MTEDVTPSRLSSEDGQMPHEGQPDARQPPRWFIVLLFVYGFILAIVADEVLQLSVWWQRVVFYILAGVVPGGLVQLGSWIRRYLRDHVPYAG